MVADFLYRVPRVGGVEEKVLLGKHGSGETVRRVVGGVTLNHLAWARILGLDVGICGRQADDDVGRFLRQGMDRIGIVRDLEITRGATASSFAQIFVDPQGGRTIYMCSGTTGETTAQHVRAHHAAILGRAAIVTTEISQLPLDAVVAVCEIARSGSADVADVADVVIDLDIAPSEAVGALGSREDLERALRLATILKPARAAAAELLGAAANADPLSLARGLRARYGTRLVAMTAGEHGCAIVTEGAELVVPGFPINPVDSTGAGDAFLGGLLCGLRLGLSLERAARLANACGAACCEITGAFPDLERSRARVEELYGEALPTPAIELMPKKGPGRRPGEPVDPFFEVALRELTNAAHKVDGPALGAVCDLVLASEAQGGRVHVTGVGKPEHVARFVASHLSSTGTAAYFLHATETVHGSAGSVRTGDVVIAISNSGETLELLAAVEALRRLGARIVAVTARRESALGRAADAVLEASVDDEGGPLGLAPRASILAETLVLCALGAELEARKNLTVHQYKEWHPGGALGKRARQLADEASARDVELLVPQSATPGK
jgi:arabinose-5-phosphate isomerase